MIKDLKEIVTAIRDIGNDFMRSTGTGVRVQFRPKKSLSRMAMDGIANFSVIVEDTISVDEGMMVARSLEKNFATFLMIAMSMDPTYNLNDTRNLRDYVRQFHQNINTDGDLMGGTKISFEQVTPERLMDVAESLGVEYRGFVNEASLILHKVYEGINSAAINMEQAKINFSLDDVLEAKKVNDVGNHGPVNPKTSRDDDKSFSYGMADNRTIAISNKFEKANNAVPTLLHVKVYAKDSKNTVDFVIGVHAELHPVKQSDMILNIVKGLRNDDTFFNFIRWTTGEIRFFKDFLFCMDNLKLEAVTNSASSNKLFDIGRRRRNIAKLKNMFTRSNIMPNLTIIVTADCLERIKRDYGTDITGSAGTMQLALIRKLMDAYFLICFVVMDQGLGRVSFLMDGKAAFETHSYSSLQKENFIEDKQMKEIMKMLGRSV